MHDRDPTNSFWPSWAPALFAAVLFAATGCLTTWLAQKFDAADPIVGDMIVFAPIPADVDAWQLNVEAPNVAHRVSSEGPCVLDPNVMSVNGGSLIVEAREETSPPRFLLHWAGRHTAQGEGDCGGAADLMLDRRDLRRLANAAGGFGLKANPIR